MLINHAIIYQTNPPAPAEQHAAEELQAHLQQIFGVEFAVRELPVTVTGPVILLGRAAAETVLAGFDWSALQEDGCLVKTTGNALVLAGATPRGTLYAVYEFLDRVLGCRWFTPEYSVIPQRSEWEVSGLDIIHVPPFRYREPYFSCVWDSADWAARNRVNGQAFPLDECHGGKWRYANGGFSHTFFPLVPPEKYFATHPEYYSEINGQRTYLAGQLCLTNDELVEVICESIREWLRKDPAANIVSITQNDWNGWCQCDQCRTIDEAESSQSGTMIYFVNRVAERLEAEFPHVYFDTFAYTYTVQPPKTLQPRRNVIVRLCNITPGCDAHPLEQCEQNRWFCEALRGWGAIAPELFIWDYFNNFNHYFQPYPNIDALAADLKLYARSGVTGVFCQGDGYPPKGSGDMAELRAWLFSRLLWNPEQDAWTLVDEFLQHYYGSAAEYLREYLNVLHEKAREAETHFHLFYPLESPAVAGDIIPRCHTIFDRAEAAVADDLIRLDRVKTARLPIEYMTWKRELRFAVHGDRYQPVTAALTERLDNFFTVAEAHGVGALRERGASLAQLKSLAKGFQVITLRQDHLRLMVVPALGGRIISLLDERSGIDWIHRGEPGHVDYPTAGGYEEYTEHRWRTPGWNEEYRVEMQTENEVRLSAELENGFILQRSYRLEDGRQFITSTINNPTAEPCMGCFRSMLELSVLSLEGAVVRLRQDDGTWREEIPWQSSDTPSGSDWLEGDLYPQGACQLIRNGRTLTMNFDQTQIAKVLFDWDRPLNIIRLGLNSPGFVLQPGESYVVTQEWLCP